MVYSLFVRNTPVFQASFVRGFQGLLSLVNWKCIDLSLQLLAPWFNLLACFIGQV